MTLDEAIKHCEEVVDGHERIKQIRAVTLEECKCAEEHSRLAEWLKELKTYRDVYPNRFEPRVERERNCQSCYNYKNEYCDVLDLNPCYPEKGCDYFEPRDGRIHEICEEIKKLSERMEDIEKEIKKEKEEEIEKLKAEIEMYHLQRKLNES